MNLTFAENRREAAERRANGRRFHIKGLMRSIATDPLLELTYQTLGDQEFKLFGLSSDAITSFLSHLGCTTPLSDDLCLSGLFMFSGPDQQAFNKASRRRASRSKMSVACL